MRTIALVRGAIGRPPRDEQVSRELADRSPRLSLFEAALEADRVDENTIAGAPGLRGRALRRLPISVAQAFEAFSRRGRYDAVVSWGERLSFTYAALLKATRDRTPHVAIFDWISPPKKALVLQRVHSHIDRLVFCTSLQYEIATARLGVPRSRAVLLKWFVDQRFWRPLATPSDTICSVGREMRDYRTLLAALDGCDVPCHIAANRVAGKRDQWIADLDGRAPSPNVTIGPKAPEALRDLYARSRFVVIPLLPTDSDNGVTAILEAMAMGKPVITSRVAGQRDVVREGVTGLLVPPQDPRALREAMDHLWRNPAECERMGRAAREQVEAAHTLDAWVARLRGIVEEAVADAKSRR